VGSDVLVTAAHKVGTTARTWHLHKSVLSQRSDVLSEMVEDLEEIILSDGADVIGLMAKCVYDEPIADEALSQHAAELLEVSDKYASDALKAASEKKLVQQLTGETVVEMADLARRFNAPMLLQAVDRVARSLILRADSLVGALPHTGLQMVMGAIKVPSVVVEGKLGHQQGALGVYTPQEGGTRGVNERAVYASCTGWVLSYACHAGANQSELIKTPTSASDGWYVQDPEGVPCVYIQSDARSAHKIAHGVVWKERNGDEWQAAEDMAANPV
jgi:hypothetical protein